MGKPSTAVAAEAGVSRQCLSKWVHRWRADGEDGLHDRSSRPTVNPTATPTAVVERIVAMRKRKWSARRIALELRSEDVTIAHLATGWDAGQLKVGSFTRSERMAKWNKMLRIEEAMGADAAFAGFSAFAGSIGRVAA